MVEPSHKNELAIQEIRGELRLLDQKLDTIKGNDAKSYRWHTKGFMGGWTVGPWSFRSCCKNRSLGLGERFLVQWRFQDLRISSPV